VARRPILLGAGVLAVVMTGCASPSAEKPPDTKPADAVPAPAAKPLIAGLVNKGRERPYHAGQPFPPVDLSDVAPYGSAFTAVVINASWDQLQPEPGALDTSVVDQSIAEITTYNAQHPADSLALKLRVFAGFAAPAWAKRLDGPPVTIDQPTGAGTLGRWWDPKYRAAWADLQQQLAARYDGNPLLLEVAVSSCATLTAEPMIMPAGPAAAQQLLAAGWTNRAETDCLNGAFDDYAVWHRTAIDFAFNPFTTISPSGQRGVSTTVTDMLMTRCAESAAAGGPRCVLDNHGLSPDAATTARSAPVYAQIDALWNTHPTSTWVTFQTDGPATDICGSLSVAVAHHAPSVELWPPSAALPGFAAESSAALESWSHDLVAGQPPTCPSGP